MTFKEKLVLICTVLIVIVIVGLWPENPESRDREALASPVDWDAVVEDTGTTRTVEWMGIIASGRENSWIERNLESRFNLEITPVFMDSNAFQRRRPLMLAGGDIPDVLWNGDPLGVRVNLRNGFIMEVPYEVILRHAPTYVDYLNRYGKEAWLYAHHHGKNYGLPTFSSDANRPRIGSWRMDWLRAVGLDKVPETIEEMGEALRRFRLDDPNRSGKTDTYGWSPFIGHWSLFFAEVFAAYDVLAFDFMYKDGQVVWGGTLPEAREALRSLHTWYREGWIDPEFMLETRDGDAKFINGTVGYAYPVDTYQDYDTELSNSLAHKVRAFSPGAEITPGPPLRNRKGQRRGRSWGGAAHILQFGRHLEEEPEKIIRILHMIETITREEDLYLEAQRGRRGEHWDFSPEQGIHLLPPYKTDRVLRDKELLPRSIFFYPSGLDAIIDRRYLTAQESSWLDDYRNPSWSLVNVLGKSDVVPSAGRYLGDLRNWQLIEFVKMITGHRSIDTFDDFVLEWHRRGGDVITREANDLYHDMQRIYQKVGAESETKVNETGAR